jgi:hypothetical protein
MQGSCLAPSRREAPPRVMGLKPSGRDAPAARDGPVHESPAPQGDARTPTDTRSFRPARGARLSNDVVKLNEGDNAAGVSGREVDDEIHDHKGRYLLSIC